MKTKILSSTVALLLAGLPMAQAQEAKPETKPDVKPEAGATSSSSSASAKVEADGSVTVEVDVNGKKERKIFKLGEPLTKLGGAAGKKILGKLEKGTWLGLAAEPVNEQVSAQLPLQPGEGLSVRHVMPESPAAKAGLQELDILLRLDDQILVSSEQLRSLVKMKKAGETVRLSYLRKGAKAEATVTLAEHQLQAADIKWLWKDGDFKDLRGELEENREELQERLRTLKDKVPGMIMEKKSFLIGPDGQLKKLYGEKLNDVLEDLRKQLEKAEISPEEREKIQKSVEEALRHAREAIEKTEDVVKQKGELLRLRDNVRKLKKGDTHPEAEVKPPLEEAPKENPTEEKKL